ncbi:MAG TPA: DUF3450 family protein [bacterium]|nr:DUF3450 family protein [bacterium]
MKINIICNAGGKPPAKFYLNKVKLLLMLLLSVSCFSSLKADELNDLTSELIKIRGEVEMLQNEIDIEKNALKNRMRAIELSKAELSNEIQRETLKIKQINLSIASKKAQRGNPGKEEETIKSGVLDSVEIMKKHIENSLPFKVEERLSALNEISDQMNNGAISSYRAVSRLWSFYEDEFRLTRENGLFSQPMEINGEKRIVTIARLGMIMAYYHYGESDYGMFARESSGKWIVRPLTEKKHIELVASLFDSLKKQIRTGFFELPVLGVMEVKK